MENSNPSSETLVDDAHVTSANGGETVGTPALTLVDLNKHLGSDFKDASTALKALKDTKDFVGKRKEDIANELRAVVTQNPSDVASKSDVQALKEELFLTQNPQYKGHVELLRKLNPDLSEAARSPEFSQLFDKAAAADEVTNSKSVVSSNARLSQVQTVVSEGVSMANARGTTGEDVALVFARSINQQNNQG